MITSGPPLLSPFINQAGAWELAVVDPVVRLHNLIWWNHFEWFGHVEHAAYIFFLDAKPSMSVNLGLVAQPPL